MTDRARKAGFIGRMSVAICAMILGLSLIVPGFGLQSTCVMPTSGTVSGLTLVNSINACNGSILSLYSGAAAPASPATAMLWLDTSATPNRVRQYDGTSWNLLWTVDATNHLVVAGVGGGTATVASASSTDIGGVPQAVKTITGTTNITSFGSSATPGSVHILTFTNVLTLVNNNASLILPGSSNITTAPGDSAVATYLGSGNWRVLIFSPISGAAVANPSVPLGTFLFGQYGNPPAKTVYGYGQALSRASYPAYMAAVTRTQTGVLTSGGYIITGVPNTQGLGNGMPIEGTGIQAGTVIAAVTSSSTIQLSNTMTVSGTQSLTVFTTGYGTGGDSTTVGAGDCRGRAIAGRDNMGGAAANRLTTLYFGGDPTAIGAVGGAQSYILSQNQLPPISPTISRPVGGNNYLESIGAAGDTAVKFSGTGQSTPVIVSISPTSSTPVVSQLGLGYPYASVQPTQIAECVVAVLP